VADKWAVKLADVAFSSARVGIVGPLSNAASHQSIPSTQGMKNQTAINELPKDMGIKQINDALEKVVCAGLYPSVPLVHGFCFALSRSVLESVGYLDENNFPNGYGEENDYCFRAAEAGFDLKIATHTYVFHAKSKSYGGGERAKIVKQSLGTLGVLHSEEKVRSAVRIMEEHPLLIRIREESKQWYGNDVMSSKADAANL
jgi:hypothetical protein